MKPEGFCFSDLLESFINQNKMYHFEGDCGLDHLTKIVKALGYHGHGFQYGTPIECFLSDNLGAITAILKWIEDVEVPEWAESLQSEIISDEESQN